MPSLVSVQKTKQWPKWDRIVYASDADLEDHAWYQLRHQRRDEPAPRVDKGKGRATDGDVHFVDTTAIEAPRACTQTQLTQQERRDSSHSRRRSTHIKLEPTVDTENDEKLAQAASVSRRMNCRRSVVHIHTPVEGFEVAEEEEKCIQCMERKLPCAVKPGRACWPCYCSRRRCSNIAGLRAVSRAPTPWPRIKRCASTTKPGPSRAPSAKPAMSLQQSKSFVVCILIC